MLCYLQVSSSSVNASPPPKLNRLITNCNNQEEADFNDNEAPDPTTTKVIFLSFLSKRYY